MRVLALIYLAITIVKSTSTAEPGSFEHGIAPGNIGTNCTCGRANRDHSRIIGGQKADKHEWPMMAGIMVVRENMFYFICGGTILTHRHVLTAAHCVHKNLPKDVRVFLGGHNKTNLADNDPNTFLTTPQQFIIHPKFSLNPSVVYDIAIIVLDHIEYSAIIEPACIPTERFDPTNKVVKVMGWGLISVEKPRQSDVLKELSQISMSPEDCKNTLSKGDYDEHKICLRVNGSTPCVSDSGGPVLWVDPDTNRYTLIGVVSYSPSFCSIGPVVVGDVSYFEPWIQQKIAETVPEERTCAKV